MNIFGVIYRYLRLKQMKPEELKKQVPRASIFGGKAAPGYWMVTIAFTFLRKSLN
jgi:starch phosphorylase